MKLMAGFMVEAEAKLAADLMAKIIPVKFLPPVAFAICSLSVARPARAATFNVSIQNFAFVPQTITINAGDTVVWTNFDSIGHSVTGSTGTETICGNGTFGLNGSCRRTFTSAGAFAYHCIPHPFMIGTVNVQSGNSPPVVNLTNPPNNKVFAAPATFTLAASASDPNGSVASVEFLSDTNSLGLRTNQPFALPVSNLIAGTYKFKAIATDNQGARGTSGPVNVSVVTAGPLQFDPPKISNETIVVTYSTTPLLSYVLQSSSDLPPVWRSIATNLAAGSSLSYTTNLGGANQFFRAFILQ